MKLKKLPYFNKVLNKLIEIDPWSANGERNGVLRLHTRAVLKEGFVLK